MPQTPNSSSVPYCTGSQYLLFYDARLSGQLVRDDGTSVDPGSLVSDSVLNQMLKSASGELEAACAVGDRYQPTDLSVMATSGGNGAAYLARMVADLAFGLLHDRRGIAIDTAHLGQVEAARKALADLRDGMAIFPFAESERAGLANDRMRTELEIEAAGLLTRSSAARRFLGIYRPGSPYGPYRH